MRFRALLLKLGLLLASLVVGLFIVEAILALIASPSRIHEQVTNPPNLSIEIDNIEFKYLWETNSQGIRYPEIPLGKPAGEIRVFVVGDSFTDGEGVNIEERFTTLLEERFSSLERPVRFINAGLGGQGALAYARIFHWIGTRYEPDALLICVNANDVSDARPGTTREQIDAVARLPQRRWERAVYLFWPRLWCRAQRSLDSLSLTEYAWEDPAEYDIEGLAARARREGIARERIEAWRERLPQDWIDLARQGKLYAYLLSWGLFRPGFFTTALDIEGPGAEEQWLAMSELLTATVEEARQRGIEVALLFQPVNYLYDPALHEPGSKFPFHYLGGDVRAEWLHRRTEVQRRLEHWARDLELPYLDQTPQFREACRNGCNLQYELDGHWNPDGHRLAADGIESWLRDRRPFEALP